MSEGDWIILVPSDKVEDWVEKKTKPSKLTPSQYSKMKKDVYDLLWGKK